MTPSNVGTDDNGFSAERDEITKTVVVKAKGLWSPETAAKLIRTVGELVQRGPTAHFVTIRTAPRAWRARWRRWSNSARSRAHRATPIEPCVAVGRRNVGERWFSGDVKLAEPSEP